MSGLASTLGQQRLVVLAIVVLTLVAAAVVAPAAPRMLLVLLGAGFGLVLLLRQPSWGLVAMAGLSFTLPLTIGTGTEVSLTAPVLLIPAVALAWLAGSLGRHSVRLRSSPATLPLLSFVGSSVLSLVAGTAYWDPLVHRPANLLFVQLGQIAIFALSALAFLLPAELARDERWLQAATFVFIGTGSIVVLQYLVPGIWSIGGWSIAGQANTAMLWTWLGAMAAGQLACNNRLSAAVRLALAAVLVGSAYVVLVVQREWLSGWVPFTVAVLAVLGLRVWRSSRAATVALGLLLILIAVVAYPQLYEFAGGKSEEETSLGGRLLLYRQTLELVKGRSLLGLGPAAYRHYGFTRWLSLGVGRALYAQPQVSSHNNFIDIYAQTGLVGLALLLWFLFVVARIGQSLLPRYRGDFAEGYVLGALSGLVGTVVAMTLVDWFLPFVYNVGFNGFRTSALAWMFLGGLVPLLNRAPEDTSGPQTGNPFAK